MSEMTLGGFALKLLEMEVATVLSLKAGLHAVAEKVENTAKDKIGHYQLESGPFPAWAELADSTKADRMNKGYDPDEPLLREGTLRDSIVHEVEGLEAIIGSKSDIAVYQEFGTARIPPRPFIGPAAFENRHKIEAIIGLATITGLTLGKAIPSELGYDISK